MRLQKPGMVMFDLDGTLVDTAPDLALSIDLSLGDLGLPACGEQQVREWIGSGIESLLHRTLTGKQDGIAEAGLFQRAHGLFLTHYTENLCRHSRIYPGVEPALDALQSARIPMACVTNKNSRFTEGLLKAIGLYDRFDIVVCGDTLPVKKPHPEPILHALAPFSVKPAAALMVGDSETDIRAARAAGCPVLCVPYGYNMGRDIRQCQPDAVFEDLGELATLVYSDLNTAWIRKAVQ